MAARGKYDKGNIAKLIAKLWGGIADDQFELLKEHLEIRSIRRTKSSIKTRALLNMLYVSYREK